VHGDGIELHLDLPAVATDDVHAADAGDRLESWRHHLVGEIRDLAQRPLAALQRERHDRRVVRIEVLDDGIFDVRRQRAPDTSDLRLHVLLRDADVDAEVEGQPNL
jgi:hypothetical protein